MVLTAVISFLTVGQPAEAYVTAKPGSVGVNERLPVPISGSEILTAHAILVSPPPPEEIIDDVCDPCPLPHSPSDSTDDEEPSCINCIAWNQMAFEDHGDYENIRVSEISARAGEIIDAMDVHGVLIRGDGKCTISDAYDGEEMWSSAQVRYEESYAVVSSGWVGGFNRKWMQAGGWHWVDDGGRWEIVDGSLDICKVF